MPSGRFRGGWGQDLGDIVGRYIDAKGHQREVRRLGLESCWYCWEVHRCQVA